MTRRNDRDARIAKAQEAARRRRLKRNASAKAQERIATLKKRIASWTRELRRAETELRDLERPRRQSVASRRPPKRPLRGRPAAKKLPPKEFIARRDIKNSKGEVIARKGERLIRIDE
jgi:hypothetical protein